MREGLRECEGEWQCELCNKIFNNVYNAVRHTKGKRKCDERVLYRCEECGREYVDKVKYESHVGGGRCLRRSVEREVQVNFVNDKYSEIDSFMKIFMPVYLYNFWKYVYGKINIEEMGDLSYRVGIKTRENLLVENCLKFLSQLDRDDLQDFYGILMKRLKNLEMDRIYIFYCMVRRNVEYLGREEIGIWNERLGRELVGEIRRKNEGVIDFS